MITVSTIPLAVIVKIVYLSIMVMQQWHWVVKLANAMDMETNKKVFVIHLVVHAIASIIQMVLIVKDVFLVFMVILGKCN